MPTVVASGALSVQAPHAHAEARGGTTSLRGRQGAPPALRTPGPRVHSPVPRHQHLGIRPLMEPADSLSNDTPEGPRST